jgi:hypothetical protein
MNLSVITDCLSQSLGTDSLVKPDTRYRCVKCKTKMRSWKELHPHHVTYAPSLVKYLCCNCHARITHLNLLRARISYEKLTSEIRLEVWRQFLEEEITEEEYAASIQWFNEFKKKLKERAAS